MDTKQAELEMASRLAGLAFTIAFVLALAFGFAEFPTHKGFIAAAFVFVHLSVVCVLVTEQLERKKNQDLIWWDLLTIQFGVTHLAQKILAGDRLDDEQSDLLWGNARERATHDALERPALLRKYAALSRPPKSLRPLFIGLVFFAAYYAVAVGVAVLVSWFL